MLTATIGTALLVTQAALGGHGHHDRRVEDCDRCEVQSKGVLSSLTKLQTSPRWRERDDAAHDLREVDWRAHPEVVGALAFTLLNDPEEEVREEAAESLAKMAPCLPVAHAALARAAECDRDYATRHWARKGLKAVRKNPCEATCQVCGPADEGGFIVPEPGLGPIVGETIMPGLPLIPGKTILEPGFDSRVESETIPPLPPLEESGVLEPSPLAPLVEPSEASPIPPFESGDESLEPLPLEAPGPSADAATVKPVKHVETTKNVETTKRVAQGRKRVLPRFLRLPAVLRDR